MLRQHSQLMITLQVVCDLLMTAAAWGLAYPLRFRSGLVPLDPAKGVPPFADEFLPLLPVVLVVSVLCYYRAGMYQPRRLRSLLSEALLILKAFGLSFIVLVAILYFRPRAAPLSRWFLACYFGLGLVATTASRVTAAALLRAIRRRGWNLRYAAIVGTGRLAQTTLHTLRRNRWCGIVVRYFVSDRQAGADEADPDRAPAKLHGVPVVGPYAHVDRIVEQVPVDSAFVALPADEQDRLPAVLAKLSLTSADVRTVLDVEGLYAMHSGVSELDGLPIVTLRQSPLYGWPAVLKRAFDLVGSALLLIVAAVPMAIIALLVKLSDRGPVFYRQVRSGLDGRPFTMIKFRTMRPDAEDDHRPGWTVRNDPRCTRVGRWLRRTSLDELPQLFNVVIGRMSLVGPRPERPELIANFKHEIPRYMLRHKTKAGMTGWAQVHGLRGDTSLRKRLQYDLYYIRNWSLMLDIRILLMTLAGGWVNPHE